MKQPNRIRLFTFNTLVIMFASALAVQAAFAQIPTITSQRGVRVSAKSTIRGHASAKYIVLVDRTVRTGIETKPENRPPEEQKIEPSLIDIMNQIAIDSSFAKNAVKPEDTGLSDELAPRHIPVRADDQNRVFVYVMPSLGFTNADVRTATLAAGGMVDIAEDKAPFVQIWIPVNQLKALAAHKEVRGIRRILDPITNTGSVTSLGVSRLRADVSFSVLSTTGSGIKVGVMSDDCSSGPGGHLATSISTGDIDSNFVSLSDPDSLGGEHEGLAMSEIVQDVAPKAQIYFATAFSGEVGFGTNMDALAHAGCKVICDDVEYSDEPPFEDGYLAMVVDSLCANGVVYVSSAGNQAGSSDLLTYANMNGTGLLANDSVFNFGSNNQYLPITLYGGYSITILMQWDDPYLNSSNDYNIYLINPGKTAIVDSSVSVQNSYYPYPYEEIDYTVPGSGAQSYYIAIVRKTVSSADPNPNALIKLTGWPNTPIIAFGSPVSSTYGHSCADSCLGAGAIYAASSNYNTIESYSGNGPSYHITYGTGTRTIDETRLKPDLAAFDGVATTVPGFSAFYGTSAASPHIAGTAAILWSANPTMTATQVRAAMRAGTIDEGAAGNDYVFGYGRLDAFKAITQALSGTGKSLALFKTVNTAIPDGTSSLSSTISPTLTANADSVYLSFTIDSHPKWGDLTVTLTSPDNTTRTVLTRPPNGTGTSTGEHPNVVLGDNASTALETYSPGATEVIGFYIPQNTISTTAGFHNRRINGNWTLNVADAVSGNSGTLKDWGIYWKTLPEGLVLTSTPPYIWSSDSSLKTVTVNEIVNSGKSPVIKLDTITANEAVAGGDIIATTGTNTTSLQLRAKCDSSIGRVYSAKYELTDSNGYDSVYYLSIPVLRQIGHNAASPITSSGGTSLGMPSVNPLASGTTTFSYILASAESIDLSIYDLHGKWQRSVDNGAKTLGPHNIMWDGTSANGTLLPDGTYVYQLNAGGAFLDGTVTLNH